MSAPADPSAPEPDSARFSDTVVILDVMRDMVEAVDAYKIAPSLAAGERCHAAIEAQRRVLVQFFGPHATSFRHKHPAARLETTDAQ